MGYQAKTCAQSYVHSFSFKYTNGSKNRMRHPKKFIFRHTHLFSETKIVAPKTIYHCFKPGGGGGFKIYILCSACVRSNRNIYLHQVEILLFTCIFHYLFNDNIVYGGSYFCFREKMGCTTPFICVNHGLWSN